MGDARNQPQIMADEAIGEIALPLQAAEQGDHLRLDGDIERGRGFVEHEHLRLQDEGAGERNALALAAAEFMRTAVERPGIEADGGEGGADGVATLGLAANVMDDQGLLDLGDDGKPRIEGLTGILQHDLQGPAQRAALGGRLGRKILAGEADFARRHGKEAGDHHGDGGLAAAALAHHGKGLAGIDVK